MKTTGQMSAMVVATMMAGFAGDNGRRKRGSCDNKRAYAVGVSHD